MIAGRIKATEARELADKAENPDVEVWLDVAHKQIDSAARRGGRKIVYECQMSAHRPSERELEAIEAALTTDGYSVFRKAEGCTNHFLVICW